MAPEDTETQATELQWHCCYSRDVTVLALLLHAELRSAYTGPLLSSMHAVLKATSMSWFTLTAVKCFTGTGTAEDNGKDAHSTEESLSWEAQTYH